ncbi:MAG TPA: bifunctional diguanylate cyclase/phosphodiesterase [Marinobacterium sp.]|nr:bifunctional diguanylate cyclase/phosphodiesterase [Marinobacterium sp.]
MDKEAITILFCTQERSNQADRIRQALCDAGLTFNWRESNPEIVAHTPTADVILLYCEPASASSLDNWLEAHQSNFPPVVQLLLPDTRPYPTANAAIHLNQLGALATTLLYVTEPNRLKRACEQSSLRLVASEERFRRLFEDTTLASLLITGGKISDANRACATLFGAQRPQDLLGLSLLDLSPPSQPSGQTSAGLAGEAISVTMTQGTHRFEWESLRLDRSPVWLRVITTLLSVNAEPVIHAVFEDLSVERDQRQRLEFLAYHDSITGLPDRNACILRIDQMFTQQPNTQPAVLKLGVDDFKSLNNLFGYQLADKLLVLVSQRLASGLVCEHELFRMPGGKFAILLSEVQSSETLQQIAESTLLLFESPFELEDFSRRLQISIGASYTDSRQINAQTLLQEAQIALSEAQKNKAFHYSLFEPAMRAKRDNNLRLREQLRQALINNEFEMYYQPQMELRSKRVTGAESLIRWNHPTRGLVPPNEFIPIAEESGLIVQMTRWILVDVCRQGRVWLEKGWEDFTLAVNLSAEHFDAGTVEADIDHALSESGLPPQHLEIELTESTLLNRTDELIVLLERLRQRDIKLAIDDFGTGYSNLSYLSQLPVQKLKIDQSFIADYFTNKGNRAVVQATVLLARSLKLATIAEGVEKPLIADSLYAIGCDSVQGYLLSKPMPARAFEMWLESHKAEQRMSVFTAGRRHFPNT